MKLFVSFFILVAAVASLNTAIAENMVLSLFERLGRPATLSGHNAPSAFAKYLDKMNEQKIVLIPADEEANPLAADVWVLFFQNEREVSLMPRVIQELYDALPEATGEPASRYLEFQLSNGQSKAASFHFVDNYSGDSEEVIACKAAVALYSGVAGNRNSIDRMRMTEECESLTKLK